MQRALIWRTLLVLAVVAYAAGSFWPPYPRSVLQLFEQQARNPDDDFKKLVAAARAKLPQAVGEYEALRDAVLESKLPLKKYFRTTRLVRPDLDAEVQEYLQNPAVATTDDPAVVAEANRLILRHLLRQAEGRIGLGLDLKGGSSFLLKVDMSRVEPAARSLALEQVVEIIRRRVDALGVSEPLIQPVGDDRLMVQIPGALSDELRREAAEMLKRVSVLEFRLTYQSKTQVSPEQQAMADDAEAQELIQRGEIPPGYEVKEERERRKNPATNKYEWHRTLHLVKTRPEEGLTGKYIARAFPYQDQMGQVIVSFEFNSEGAKIFERITRDNIGRRLAIILDGELKSAPTIQSVISQHGQITGRFSLREAQELANVLQNPLEHPLELEEERTVTATLGAESVRAGFVAGVVGLSLVALFMLGYYLAAGLVANLCLAANIVLLLGALAQLGFTLTLPGIAAVILTIGMAVDSNVLIYERLREEIATGKKLRSAVPLAFRRAFWTILDANVTTLITAVMLIKFSSGPVLGFAIVLTAGVITSVFSAMVVCRLFFDWLLQREDSEGLFVRSRPQREARMFHLIRAPRVDFLQWRKASLIASTLLVLISLALFVLRAEQGTMFSVDFVGGDSFALKFEKRIPADSLSAALMRAAHRDVLLQYQTQLEAGGAELLHVRTPFEKGEGVLRALQTQFPEAKFVLLGQVDRVGPLLGMEFALRSALGLSLGLLGILLYVSLRFEFSFALGAIAALVHDVLLTIGCLALLQKQLTLPMIGAILTVAGYSINDTIVVFDRIREGLKTRTGSIEELMNASLNETLSRTLLTSGTTLLTLFAIFFFGGATIHDFALALIVGITVGTYSSLFIASPIVLIWGKRRGGLEVGEKMAGKPL